MREGSAPNFCPPTQEGITLSFEDEKGEVTEMEFLGLVIHEGKRYGFFFPIESPEDICASGDVVLLEVVDFDEEGQPSEFELVTDEAIAAEVYADFKTAAAGLYDFD